MFHVIKLSVVARKNLFWVKLEQSPDGDGGAAWLPCDDVGRSATFVKDCAGLVSSIKPGFALFI
jgi:hypothetical protein